MVRQDRRQTARFVPAQTLEIQLSVVTGFQVLEVNAAGMLLLCDQPFMAGERTQVHTTLADEPFSARVEIKAVRQVPSGQIQPSTRYVMAAAFVSFDDRSRQALTQCLSRAAVRGSVRLLGPRRHGRVQARM